MCVYTYTGTRHGPRGPYAHYLRLLSCFCAHFACYHLVCALFACSESNDIKSLDVAVHKTNAQYLRHAQCAMSVHLYPHCAVHKLSPALFACPSSLYIFCTVQFLHTTVTYAHIACLVSLYIFCTIIVKIYQKS